MIKEDKLITKVENIFNSLPLYIKSLIVFNITDYTAKILSFLFLNF